MNSSDVMQQVAAIRGFAWAGECVRSDVATDTVVLDADGSEVGWAVTADVLEDPFRLFDAIEVLSSAERSDAFAELERTEQRLVAEFIAHAHAPAKQWLTENEESADHEQLLSLCSDDEPGRADEIDLVLARLERRDRAVLGRTIAEACGRDPSLSTVLAQSLSTKLTQVREVLFRDSLRLAVSLAKRHRFGLSWPIAVAAASEGLVIAIDRFDPSMGNQFSTYAWSWIVQRVGRVRQNSRETLRLPVHAHERHRRYVAAEREVWRWGEPRPTPEVIQSTVGIDPRNIAIYRRPVRPVVVSPDGLWGVAERVHDVMLPSPLDGGLDASWPESAGELLSRWFELVAQRSSNPIRVRRILRARIRQRPDEAGTLRAVGDEFGVSRERIRQQQEVAIRKLRRMAAKVGFDPVMWRAEPDE